MEKKKAELIRINRRVGMGQYKISDIFPGLQHNPLLLEIFKEPEEIDDVFRNTAVEVIQRQTYMFVDNGDGSISIGIAHLRESEAAILYLDIIHELVHVRQHREGIDLYDRSKAYVDRPTEIEAYVFTITEARRIGFSDKQILDYLTVEWITSEEHMRLAKRLRVAA